MIEPTLKEWHHLCKQAVVEQDPVRLLTLFLKIDHLQENGILKPRQELSASHAFQQIPCPYCVSISASGAKHRAQR